MNHIPDNSTATTSQSIFKLLDGVFTPEDAEDVLMTIVQKKINYHNDRILSVWEREGCACPTSEERLKALRAMRTEIAKVIAEAKEKGLQLDINCNIEVDLIERK